MHAAFANRLAAGRKLGQALAAYDDWPGAIVLGLPRGGVPVAFEVAKALQRPLDICLVRKLGAPGQEELAMGAIASGNVRILNPDILQWLEIPAAILEKVVRREQKELHRREQHYRGDLPQLNLQGRTVILVDDGIATGATVRAAIAAVRKRGAARVIVATPVAAQSVCAEVQREVEALVCLLTPETLNAVGYWYEDFTQTSDGEVRHLLAAAKPFAWAAPF
ncbi:MAG: phosphoribosyltransferase [Cyanobacteria bacterium J06641_5]